VRVDAAKIGRDQNIGANFCVAVRHAVRHENFADKIAQCGNRNKCRVHGSVFSDTKNEQMRARLQIENGRTIRSQDANKTKQPDGKHLAGAR
jgi:hypothetical protein